MPRDSANSIRTDELLKAYTLGYFPMARTRDDDAVVWVLPDERGVIPLNQPHVPKKLAQFMRSEPFEIRMDTAFADVIAACAETTKARPDTWINDAIIEAYSELHFQGRAHSIECWRNGKLVGGLYGVVVGAAFCGESMFSRETNASKVAMVYLMARLKTGGFHFIDAQFYNDHLTQFGLVGVADTDYQIMLDRAIRSHADFFAAPDQLSTTRVLQSITQTS
ncbi:leucyl/phenylalanyl-tRNA--protein transferase [Hyphococcus sp.]|uniref:leucyl/phenylalanyl-tRNA--protein transferase n=1 Tax=Hyphococcus sp. TaxID=2038636 RepID=UPI003CCC401C